MQETQAGDVGSIPGSGRSPGVRSGYPAPVFSSGRFYEQRSLVSYSPWGHKRVRHSWAQVVPRFADSSLAPFLTPCWHSQEGWLGGDSVRTGFIYIWLSYWPPLWLSAHHLPSLKPECLICRTSLVAQMVKCLSAMQETRVWSLGWENPLEKEMAAHSSILAWKIPWMVEPGMLPSTGLQRVGHNWARPPCWHQWLWGSQLIFGKWMNKWFWLLG